jgi:transcriptional regulator with XRE-family HTH domain
MTWHDSSARSRELGEELRKRRQHVGLTGSELAHQLGWSPSKVSRIESGVIGVSEVDAAIYLTFCGVLKEELGELLDLARQDDTTTWVQEHGGRLPDELRTLVYHETTAASIASYEPMLVPGLLQTEDYARAVFEFAEVVPKNRIGDALQVRLDRQAVLRKPDPPDCLFYLREAGLRSKVGSNRIMHEQLLHLVFLISRPQHQIRLVPADAGPHEAWGGMFMVMGFATHAPVVYVEILTNSVFLEKPSDVQIYHDVLKRLDRAALDAGQSRQLLAQLASEFDKPEDGPDEDS